MGCGSGLQARTHGPGEPCYQSNFSFGNHDTSVELYGRGADSRGADWAAATVAGVDESPAWRGRSWQRTLAVRELRPAAFREIRCAPGSHDGRPGEVW